MENSSVLNDKENINDASSNDNERPGTPDELIEMAKGATMDLLPLKSKSRYDQTYQEYKKWQGVKKASSNSERVMLSYFSELREKVCPGTLWSKYSMLKSTLKIYEDVDIGAYASLIAFIKNQWKGYEPKKAKVLTEMELRRFIDEAPDVAWLDVKILRTNRISKIESAGYLRNRFYFEFVDSKSDYEKAKLLFYKELSLALQDDDITDIENEMHKTLMKKVETEIDNELANHRHNYILNNSGYSMRGQEHRGQRHREQGHREQGHRGHGHRGHGHRGQGHRGQGHRGQGHRGQVHRVYRHRGQGHREQRHRVHRHYEQEHLGPGNNRNFRHVQGRK
ncbi:hypothetical protein Bhyg_07547 [Pseudolycoriella hygida]|uniref:Uncharacterized protein n=1 Tax=Pseudolycoriella hygida TaxID=35572 RepID=A0A9Q0N4P9_9DIPT|nr:hypothetical protein Bhyg_07547 [Pseudolycoriella hygida]